MTLPVEVNPLLLSSLGAYTISRSVRLRSSASAYFNKTLASGSTTAWTWSGWVKRGYLGANQSCLFFGDSTSTNYQGLYFTNDNLYLLNRPTAGTNAQLTTTQVFRDPSAWYHIVAVWDTANATSGDRLRLYVNGSRITAFSTATYPAQNTASVINTAIAHEIGATLAASAGSAANLFDGYLSEVNFIDGQALTPSSFGETDAVTGVWKPKKYAGTYGTNGFYLNFSDNSAATAAAIGKDYSGNGNNWTPNNISLTAGTTYDSMTDVPTLTSATAANYCVINPLDGGSASATTVSDGNLKSTAPSLWGSNSCTMGVSSGKWYWEQNIVSGSYWYAGIIIGQSNWSGQGFGQMANGYSYYSTGQKQNNNTLASYGASFTSGDVLGVALDMDAGTITFYKNNVSQGTAYTGLTGVAVPAVSGYNGSVSVMNFGQRPFSYTPPTGFKALNTFNLPTPTIVNGATVMAATLYTGDGSYPRSVANTVNGVSFQPDLVWMKARSIAYDNILYDSIRGTGTGASLISNSSSAEGADAVNANMSAFASNGFTIGSTSSTNILNASGQTFVAWQWKAGGTSSSNTNGSITSTVSVNATAGFSVVTWTNPSSGIPTIGHGLGVAPIFIIVKDRTYAYNWDVGCTSIGWANRLNLNTTGATSSGFWNSTAPTSTVFTYSSSGANSGDSMVAYCFAEVAGYSKFGSYTGNGSSDGTFVYTGFRPRFVMIKVASGTIGDWDMYDTSRDTYNVSSKEIWANSSNAERSGSILIDILSNGFKLRDSSSNTNGSGNTYVYAAFAENPFRNALAR